MKLILLFVFVFSLDIMTLMAAKIPGHEGGNVPVSNDGALTTYQVASLKREIQKRRAGLGDCFLIPKNFSRWALKIERKAACRCHIQIACVWAPVE